MQKADQLPWVKYPTPSQFENWCLLPYITAGAATEMGPIVRPKQDATNVFRTYLRDWMNDPHFSGRKSWMRPIFQRRFLKSQTTPDVPDVDDFRLSGSPYPGLRSFRPQEGNVFFGRDRSVNEIRDRLADLHVAVVLGGSGSGKSSVVRAGLIPRLNSTKKIRGCSGQLVCCRISSSAATDG